MEASSTSREPCSRPSQDGTGHARGRERTAQQAEGSQSGPQPGGQLESLLCRLLTGRALHSVKRRTVTLPSPKTYG